MEQVLDLLIQNHGPRWGIREAAPRKTIAIETVVRRPGIDRNRSCILDDRAVLSVHAHHDESPYGQVDR